ncbi:MAG: hypothetical protein IT326_05460 [Anaerolineae bacterium]|nr:hypothetical protein [Anaerolineae bacterium]
MFGVVFLIAGAGLLLLAGGIALIRGADAEERVRLSGVSPAELSEALRKAPVTLSPTRPVERFVVTATPLYTYTPTPPQPSPTPGPTVTETVPTPSAAPASVNTPPATVPATEIINWTPEEMNALSWLCTGEVGGMGYARADACLSVISTVRARYAYPSGFGVTDVMSTLRSPGQFNVTIRTDTATDMLPVVESYRTGARGSCSGYFYFNSIPGGPAACTIYGAAGQFVNFHNRW